MSLAKAAKSKLTNLAARLLVSRSARLAGQRPIASVTFDDFPRNAWTEGGPVLARHGVRATYYTAGGFCGRVLDGTTYFDVQDLQAIAAAGHELGCHGFGHQQAPDLTPGQLEADRQRNRAFLTPFQGPPVSYAFPNGRASPRSKRAMAAHFTTLRGTHEGVNTGRVDLAQLHVISLEMRLWETRRIETAIRRTLQDRGWLILYTHDVSETPSAYGSTPAMLDWALAKVAAARIDMLPVREAVRVALGA